MENVICVDFYCDENLNKYTESMLFDSGTNIAYGKYRMKSKGSDIYKTLTLFLDVSGEVRVTYKGELYRKPSEFPSELKKIIKEDPNWYFNEDIYIGNNNWFEIIQDYDGDYKMTDGYVFEDSPSDYTPETLKEYFFNEAKDYLEWLETRE